MASAKILRQRRLFVGVGNAKPAADIEYWMLMPLPFEASTSVKDLLHGLDEGRDFRQLRPDMLMHPDDVECCRATRPLKFFQAPDRRRCRTCSF